MKAEQTEQESALSDLKIIDMATIVAGPAATKYLGDFGAEVIKVESPAGDSARRLGWAFNDEDDSFFWKLIGRNKKCVTLDLKTGTGLEQMLKLVDSADALVESSRPGALERLGLAPDKLLERNPRLVILRVTGFGQTGPYARRPSFATIVEALSGYAAISGEPDGQPLLPPIAITDELVGIVGAFSLMTALWYARRTGHGQVVDVNLAESLLQLMGPLVPAYAHLGYEQPRMGSSLPWTVPRGTYQCADGKWVALSSVGGLGRRQAAGGHRARKRRTVHYLSHPHEQPGSARRLRTHLDLRTHGGRSAPAPRQPRCRGCSRVHHAGCLRRRPFP